MMDKLNNLYNSKFKSFNTSNIAEWVSVWHNNLKDDIFKHLDDMGTTLEQVKGIDDRMGLNAERWLFTCEYRGRGCVDMKKNQKSGEWAAMARTGLRSLATWC